MFSIIVHGGAGHWDNPEESRKKIEELSEAVEAGRRKLANGEGALEAVIAAVSYMEDSELFNAGRGSVLDAVGGAACDASVAVWEDGCKVRTGAVSCVEGIRHALLLAKHVMEKTDHVLLTGKGAVRFARLNGFKTEDLRTERSIRQWKKYVEMEGVPDGFGTVGAVATDGVRVAAGTSTGGRHLTLPGRVGDSAIFGCGTYAGRSLGVSCTGTGEIAMKTHLALRVGERSGSLQDAVDLSLKDVTDAYGRGNMGVIAINVDGEFAFGSNTDEFFAAVGTEDGVDCLSSKGDGGCG